MLEPYNNHRALRVQLHQNDTLVWDSYTSTATPTTDYSGAGGSLELAGFSYDLPSQLPPGRYEASVFAGPYGTRQAVDL